MEKIPLYKRGIFSSQIQQANQGSVASYGHTVSGGGPIRRRYGSRIGREYLEGADGQHHRYSRLEVIVQSLVFG